MQMQNHAFLEAASTLAHTLGCSGIVLSADVIEDCEALKAIIGEQRVLLVAHGETAFENACRAFPGVLRVPVIALHRTAQIKVAVLMGLAAGLLQEADRMVCLAGAAGSRLLDTLLVLDISKEFELLTSGGVPLINGAAQPAVLQTLLSLALEIAREGREGRPVGALFVLGDHEKVLQLSHQMVLNPFKGYSDAERTLLDPNLKETIKEFASLDGAFVIRGDGIIEAAGRYLEATGPRGVLPQGLGSRHLAAAGITAVTKAVAVVISESTSTVRIFIGGKTFMEIEK
jgi:DNA integrity scanning protein DisA with diadenylate cyclase activity